MPPTPSPSHSNHSTPVRPDSARTLIKLSLPPSLSLLGKRNRKRSLPFCGSAMIRQILVLLTLGTILLSGLFLYSSTSKSASLVVASYLSLDRNRPPPIILSWQQVEHIIDDLMCSPFQPPREMDPTTTRKPYSLGPREKTCQAPLEPFDSAAFANRPSGNKLIDFSRTLLLVLFNHPHAETIPFIEVLYRPHFPNIIYCLPEAAKNPSKVAKARQDPNDFMLPVFDTSVGSLPLFRVLNSTFFMDVDIVTYPQPFMNRMAGENNYACFVEVSRRLLLAPNVDPTASSSRRQLRASDFDGVLVAADDLLVHVWNLAQPGYDPKKPWVMDRPIRVYDTMAEHECAVDEPPQDLLTSRSSIEQHVAELCQLDVDWQWFRLYAVEMGEFSNELERYALESRLFGECHHRLRETLGGQSRRFIGNGGAGDFYYIPASMLLQAHDVLSLMAAHNIFVEIAIPTAIRCLVANASTDIIHVQGEGMNWAYARSRDRPWSAYSAASSLLLPYYHPLKVAELLMAPKQGMSPSQAVKLDDMACFICKTILPKFRWFRDYVAHNNTPPLLPPPWL